MTAVTVWYTEAAILAIKFETSGTELIAGSLSMSSNSIVTSDNTLTVGNTQNEGDFEV